MMIELEPELLDYKELEKEFDSIGYELVGIKYVNSESFFYVRKIKN